MPEEEKPDLKGDKLSYILLALLAAGGTSFGVNEVNTRRDSDLGDGHTSLKTEIMENRKEAQRRFDQVDDRLRRYTEEHSELRYRVLFIEKSLETLKKKIGE